MTERSTQFSVFRDCVAQQLISRQKADVTDASELDDFVDYLAEESWSVLPGVLQEATYQSRTEVPEADEVDLESTTSPMFTDTLVSYGIVGDADDAIKLLRQVVEQYRAEACAPPPVWSSTRTTECEICERQVPLTYHHLIPRSTHDKVLKKGWHDESMLNSVAWLCRCASGFGFVTRDGCRGADEGIDLAIQWFIMLNRMRSSRKSFIQ